MMESVQYNAVLAITGAIDGSSRDRRWCRKLCFYYKIRHNNCPLTQPFFCLLWNLAVTVFVHITLKRFLKSELNFSNQQFPPPARLIRTNLTRIYKIVLHLNFSSQHFLVLFVLCQHKYTRFTIQKD